MQNYFQPQLLWVDLEMSGLDPLSNRIIQFACILTDRQLLYQCEGPHLIINCDEDHLKSMDEWNTSHHKASGLYESCLKSDVTIAKAEEMILEKLVSVGIKEGQLIIAGNSVHMDKLFIYHHMPKLYVFLHSDILDVSSIKLFVNAKNPYLFYKKLNKHRALDDIRESIGELAFYMQYALK